MLTHPCHKLKNKRTKFGYREDKKLARVESLMTMDQWIAGFRQIIAMIPAVQFNLHPHEFNCQ